MYPAQTYSALFLLVSLSRVSHSNRPHGASGWLLQRISCLLLFSAVHPIDFAVSIFLMSCVIVDTQSYMCCLHLQPGPQLCRFTSVGS